MASAQQSRRSANFISGLFSDSEQVSYVGSTVDMTLRGCSGTFFTIVLVRSGVVERRTELGSERLCAGVFTLAPGRDFTLTLSAGFSGCVVQLDAPSLRGQTAVGLPVREALHQRLLSYLCQSRFFYDHHHAVLETRRMKADLLAILSGGDSWSLAPRRVLDPRVERALVKMLCDTGWRFDLDELAGWSGASRRNLYYLMKTHVGMTPYRFHQRCRLIRVRERLADCHSARASISRYACDEGFAHPGRFSALYLEHFGELPSDTVHQRRRLADKASPVG